MFEYKVDIYKVKYAEEAMNTLAKEGWRVIAVSPDHHTGFIDVFYEREAAADGAAHDESTAAENTAAKAEKVYDTAEDISDETEDGGVQYAVRDDIWDFDGEETESE